MTYMLLLNCALKLVEEIILYYDAQSKKHQILEECGPCPVLASYTLAFTLQPRKKHGKTSVRVAASFFFFALI